MLSFRRSRSSHRRNSRFTKLVSEQLESRTLMAADIGSHCLEWELESSSLITPVMESEASPRSSTTLAIKPTAATGTTKPPYSYSLIGNAGNYNAAQALGGLAIMGGGTDVNAAFSWMGQRTNGGDFVILSFSSTSYGKYISGLGKFDSVETLVVPSLLAANDPFVASKVAQAEGIFITGGDQANYINNWTNTALETAIYTAMVNNKAVLGGTSAGLAVMGEVDFAALSGTITSSEALSNPNDSRITLDTRFVTPTDASSTPLTLLNDTLLESHFQQRDRMGRAIAFTANMAVGNMLPKETTGDAIATPRTIAVNEQTALLVLPDGTASVVGNPYDRRLTIASQRRAAFFINGSSISTVGESLPSGPLTYSVNVGRFDWDPALNTSKTFNINSWTSADAMYTVDAKSGVLTTTGSTLYG